MNLVHWFLPLQLCFVSSDMAFGVLLRYNVDKAFLSSWNHIAIQSGVEGEIKMPKQAPYSSEHAQLSIKCWRKFQCGHELRLMHNDDDYVKYAARSPYFWLDITDLKVWAWAILS